MASKAASFALIPLVLFALAGGFAWWWTQKPIPPLDGRTPVPGLAGAVAVRFDEVGIPHIDAGGDADAWIAVGYLQARDRLWQMELYRRAASGRLAELLGKDLLPIDERFLTLGLRHAAELEWQRTSPGTKSVLENYSRGVNAALAASTGLKLPLELQLLRVRLEPWTPVDSLAIGKLFAWRLGENHHGELLRYELISQLGPRAAELLGPLPGWAKGILAYAGGERGVGSRDWGAGRRGARPEGLAWLSGEHHAASNSWVLSGSRTASGRPLLANDPHLAIELPSTWWEMHVASRSGLDVSGVTIPGAPFVVIGHNSRIAWGLTNSGADVQDFFVERLDPSRKLYLFENHWIPIETRHYEIRVKGRTAAVPFDVRSTRHGPVLNADEWQDPVPGRGAGPAPLQDTVLALKWDAVRDGGSAAGFEALARADNWRAFVAAARDVSVPSQNFVYADVDGNIGYVLSGLVPVRHSGDGSMPGEGSSPEADWRGTIPFEELPAVLNPPDGLIVTSNNEIDRGYGYLLTRDWVAPFRAQRITALLGSETRFDIASFERAQADVKSLAADSLLTTIGAAAPDELRGWDRQVDSTSTAVLYEAFEEALWRRTFADEMPPELYGRFYRYAANERFAGLHAIISDANSPWFDDRATPSIVETRDDIVRLAARDARATLTARYGAPANWRWDEIHAARFSHALAGGGRLLDWFFSRGPVPLIGDVMTVNKTTTNFRRPYATSEAASYRQILDVGAWDASVAVNIAGQSGHPRSAHYFDQNLLWRQGRYHSLPFTRSAVEASTASRLELAPGR